jgi:hypothetical protein
MLRFITFPKPPDLSRFRHRHVANQQDRFPPIAPHGAYQLALRTRFAQRSEYRDTLTYPMNHAGIVADCRGKD